MGLALNEIIICAVMESHLIISSKIEKLLNE